MKKNNGMDGVSAILNGEIGRYGYENYVHIEREDLGEKESMPFDLKKCNYPNDGKLALSIARQKAMLLRGLHECGYVNIDTKLENIMISKRRDKLIIDWLTKDVESIVVSMIDVGGILRIGQKKDDILFGYTEGTVAPEVLQDKYEANTKSDVFSDAIERPLIIFGGIATIFFKEIYPELYKKVL